MAAFRTVRVREQAVSLDGTSPVYRRPCIAPALLGRTRAANPSRAVANTGRREGPASGEGVRAASPAFRRLPKTVPNTISGIRLLGYRNFLPPRPAYPIVFII